MNLGSGHSIPLGSGHSIPLGKGALVQSGDVWFPATPEKPVMQRPNPAPVEMQQHNQLENWQDLLGIYSGVLQDDSCDLLPKKVDPNSLMEHTVRDIAPIGSYSIVPQNFKPTGVMGLNCEGQYVRDVAPVETYSMVPQNFNRASNLELNRREHKIQDVAQVDKFRSLNQKATGVASYVSDVVPPRKVHSLAELIEMESTLSGSSTKSDRIAYAMDKPATLYPPSPVESNGRTYNSAGVMLQQNHFSNRNQDIGGYSLQQMPNCTFSVPYQNNYNLNLPPTTETGESSSAAREFRLEPVTSAKQNQLNNHQIIQATHFLIDEHLAQEKDKHDKFASCQQPGKVDSVQNGFLHNTPCTSAAISTSVKQRDDSDGRIDLNKTPPQKPPKRKKHRPKVVVEGKPKKTPKPKINTPEGNPRTKRKYMSKKNTTSPDQSANAATKVEVSHVESRAKSCRRALNFDLENGVEKKSKGEVFDYRSGNFEGSKVPFNLNLDPHNAEWYTALNGQFQSAVHEMRQELYEKEKHGENLYDFIQSVNKIPPQESVPLGPIASPATFKDHTLNVIARSLNVRNASITQSCGQNKYNQVHDYITGGLTQLVVHANTIDQSSDGKRQSKLQTRTQLQEDMVNVNDKQESKRVYSHTEPQMPSRVWSYGVSEMNHYNREGSMLWQNASETRKTESFGYRINGTSSAKTSSTMTIGDCSERIESRGNMSFHAQSKPLHLDGRLQHSDKDGKIIYLHPNNETNKVTHNSYMNSTGSGRRFQKQHAPLVSCAEQMAPHHTADVQNTSPLTGVANCHPVNASQGEPKFSEGHKLIDYPSHMSSKRKTAKHTSPKKPSSMDKVARRDTKKTAGYGHYSRKVKESQGENRNVLSIDDIIDRVKDLNLNNNDKEIVGDGQRALVPFGSNSIVVFEAFDPIKKRRPRPKVDLDPETNKLWNLLMGKEGSESAETMDNDKQKWWEEERKVFRGRVDSFIARMHLVQGDRRFSKWKGSVVDSVIGVFLTQNVSDHLSSSAFMSLAAKFPSKPTTSSGPWNQNGGKPSREHEVHIWFPDGTSYDHIVMKEAVYNKNSGISTEFSECGEEIFTSGRNFSVNNHTRRIEEGIMSSQSSSESIICQVSEDIRSSSGSNSEAEDQIIGCSFTRDHDTLNLFGHAERETAFQQYHFQAMGSSFMDKTPSGTTYKQSENPRYSQNPGASNGTDVYAYQFTETADMLHYQRSVPSLTSSWQKMTMGLEKWEADVLAFLGKESTPSLASTDFDIINGAGIEYDAHDKAGQSAESCLTIEQTGTPRFQSSIVNQKVLNKHLEPQNDIPTGSQRRNEHHFINYRPGARQENFQQESTGSTFQAESTKPVEALSKIPSDNRNHSNTITPEPTEMMKGHHSSVPPSKINTTSASRKRKAEKERAEPFDWDTLRKQVQPEPGTRGRSRDAMDSLDYEALLNANVREISDAIKERGMNNMLAERIKDFLNRLVEDHGGIDLEWLRDVQPDKAKDYLLSIRGLGLKSVECVRLLTLHHLAFPVDTNVGRIAVRLGWVPLQPLPESLQLHLLELYPVLESIQKYLWPRLCKLDQETLYELHYQMITFGKVFCTKREPNCNACPMRGECRHFASAFASARLALPGPEDRRIVSSAGGTSPSKSSDMFRKPMILPPDENNSERENGFTRNCEPIIEEPTTPEPHNEVSERDIEDAFYEDPDEIPVIKLNIEEFTTNLQSFIEEKIEMQGDMSKALVALSPTLASIPVPKLKRASRLRTEHQVYELPDSHPLLKGLDRREPDDPSPYLLAIWTPGETADSVQPPQSTCSCPGGGGLCNNETCFSCSSTREAQNQTVRGTILIPCRTAMRGSFPLNGTYFQVNEVFADHESSINPIDVPRSLIWNLPRRTVFFGTSVSTIFKGLSTEGIQFCFWKGFVCVRGFDHKTRAPRPLKARLHLPASKTARQN